MTCHICHEMKPTKKKSVFIELSHPVPVPLTMNVAVCTKCTKLLSTVGVEKVRNTRLVIY